MAASSPTPNINHTLRVHKQKPKVKAFSVYLKEIPTASIEKILPNNLYVLSQNGRFYLTNTVISEEVTNILYSSSSLSRTLRKASLKP